MLCGIDNRHANQVKVKLIDLLNFYHITGGNTFVARINNKPDRTKLADILNPQERRGLVKPATAELKRQHREVAGVDN